jgi:hypothetical protein
VRHLIIPNLDRYFTPPSYKPSTAIGTLSTLANEG